MTSELMARYLDEMFMKINGMKRISKHPEFCRLAAAIF